MSRHKVLNLTRRWTWLMAGSVRSGVENTLYSQATGALVRTMLVVVMISTPSLLLVGVTADTKQMVSLIALLAGVLTFVEYNGTYPSLIEFRDAPPYNRVRFFMLFCTVFFIAIVERGRVAPSVLSELIDAIGTLIGLAMDFPYSPVRLCTLMLAEGGSDVKVAAVRTAAGMAYLTSLISLAIFVILLRAGRWPRADRPFNVWVNLPTFDPTVGGDVIRRLNRDARVNIALGCLLPFLIPTVVRMSALGYVPLTLTSSQTLIWTVTAWAFLPSSLFMRGIAMRRIADMIRDAREAHILASSGKRFASA